jgi:hypothetical protein
VTQEQLEALKNFMNDPPSEAAKIVIDLYKQALQARQETGQTVTRLQNELNSATASYNKLVAQEGALLTAVSRLKDAEDQRRVRMAAEE